MICVLIQNERRANNVGVSALSVCIRRTVFAASGQKEKGGATTKKTTNINRCHISTTFLISLYLHFAWFFFSFAVQVVCFVSSVVRERNVVWMPTYGIGICCWKRQLLPFVDRLSLHSDMDYDCVRCEKSISMLNHLKNEEEEESHNLWTSLEHVSSTEWIFMCIKVDFACFEFRYCRWVSQLTYISHFF